MLRAAVSDPDRVIFASPIAMVGEFRCPVGHPRFEDSGPTRQYCFVFPRHACWIEHEGERPFVADSTVMPLYNIGRPYRRAAISPDGDRTDWFAVSPAVLREMVSLYDRRAADHPGRLFTRPFVRTSSRAFLAQRCVFEHVRRLPSPDRLFVEETVIGVLAGVLARMAGGAPRPDPAAATGVGERARAHLARTFQTRESVAAVADAVGVSPFHLCRVFRRETGDTLHGCRTALRLRWSLGAIHDCGDMLSVALAAGFSHHSHFTAAFRRAFGVSPSAFRAAARAGRLPPGAVRNNCDLLAPAST
jgi:AraC-like DNA-binding protein